LKKSAALAPESSKAPFPYDCINNPGRRLFLMVSLVLSVVDSKREEFKSSVAYSFPHILLDVEVAYDRYNTYDHCGADP
jgi:hypothetical protein